MKLTGNDNLPPEVLKEIDEIPTLNLGESGIINDDLLSPEATASLIKKLREHDIFRAESFEHGGRKVVI